jgi:cytochrome P450
MWARHRKLIQPAFGPSQLRHAITVTNEIVALAIEKINERIEKENAVGTLDAPKLATSLTADIMYDSLFLNSEISQFNSRKIGLMNALFPDDFAAAEWLSPSRLTALPALTLLWRASLRKFSKTWR